MYFTQIVKFEKAIRLRFPKIVTYRQKVPALVSNMCLVEVSAQSAMTASPYDISYHLFDPQPTMTHSPKKPNEKRSASHF